MNNLTKSIQHFSLKRTVLSSALLSLLAIQSTLAADAKPAEATAPATTDAVSQSIENALKFGQADAKYGQIKFNLNFRYENVDTGRGSPATANAFTARLRLGYLTPVFEGLQGFVEYEGNQDIVANDYNSARNGKGKYEIIADPQQHELNQLWISYKGLPDTEIKVGRQRIDFDNLRFIGAVDWRQMQQTFDAVLVTNTSLPNTTIKAGYINKIQTVNSFTKGAQIPFLNINYAIKDVGNLVSYAYLMDFNEPILTGGAPTLGGMTHNDSNQTYGIRLDGSRKINDDLKAHYLVEYAYQKEYVQNPTHYHASYYHIVGGATAFGITAKAGMEQLDSGGANRTFDTPLATLHIFNGWADQFLATPNNGLRDVYGSLATEIQGVKLLGVYHEFTNDSGSIDYGKELDFQVSKEFFKHYTLLAKYAYFDASSASATAQGQVGTSAANRPFAFDAQKFWFGANVSF
jgi:hypothetical protein